MHLQAGTYLQGGRYCIEKVLGQGGFGITYSGIQTNLEAKVAIKEFFMKDLCNRDSDTSQVSVGSVGSREIVERFRQKFIKEARNIFRMKHRHIISVIDVFEENGTAYYVMEYVSGGSLADKVRDGALPESVAVRYIRQVAAALDFVHSRRMMHLDVKPANTLLDENDNAVLIDFGLAKQYDTEGQQTSCNPVGISHGYAPLEQYKRDGVSTFSPATDIYSLGATLFKLVTGITPPEASDVNDEGLPALPSGISPTVRAAIETAMEPKRKDRPQSIAEFLKLLENGGKSKDETLLNSSSTPGGEVSRSDGGEGELKTENGKSKLPLIIIILLLSVILGAGGYMLFSGSSDGNSGNNDSSHAAAEQAAAEKQALLEREAEEKRAREEAERIAREKQQGISTQQRVDLGLSVCWAGWNVGASSPEEYGGYYAWGETEEKSNYSFSTYKWCNGSSDTMTKYCTSSSYGTVGNKTTLDPQDDVAHVKWGGSWRMPTRAEQDELRNNCSWTWTTYKGVNGYKVTGPNGNSIFLPAAGSYGTYLDYSGSVGFYWPSSLTSNNSKMAFNLCFDSGHYGYGLSHRYYGHSVRPVCD